MGAETEDKDPHRLGDRQSRELVGLGFDPGIPVYEVSNVDFDLDLVKRALFESAASTPLLLPLQIVADTGAAPPMPAELSRRTCPLQMVVEAVRVYYPPAVLEQGQAWALGCREQPEWYVSGYLHKAPLHPDPDRIQINAYISSKGADEPTEIDVVLLQFVRQPSGADTTTCLQWGDGIPGLG